MDIALPADLRRSGPVGRFPRETEARYRVWHVHQTRPLIRLVGMLSIPIWIAMPFMAQAWNDAPVDDGLYWASALAAVLIGVMLAVTYSPYPRLVVPTAASALVLVSFISFYGFANFLALPNQAGLLGTVVWLTLLSVFVGSPFRLTLVLTFAVTGAGSAFLIDAARELDTPRAESWSFFTLIIVDLALVPALALLNERTLRDRFVDSQVIARQRTMLRRYAPPTVADRIEIGDTTVSEAQRRRVTILFADVVGFTTLADRLDPESLAEIMNDYLGSVAEIIEQHHGTLNEFAGDGVMAIFGAPDELDPADQAHAALAAAQELQQRLPGWSRRWYSLGIDQDLRARIGINTGVVSVGTFGSAVRATYTGIGLQTNIAARIQAQCPPGSVLLSKTSWSLVADDVACEPRGEVTVKGVHFPIAMYEPVPV